jgi:uroporphyrinogen decarboxylase
MPRLVEWGIHLVSPVQPKCNDIYALKRQYGDRIAFRGNMNIEGVLAFGTPAQVRADTREHIERLAGDGGYVVGSSHSIVDAIPPANYFAMIEAACEFGVY